MSEVKFDYEEFKVLQVALIELAILVEKVNPKDKKQKLEVITNARKTLNDLLVKNQLKDS